MADTSERLSSEARVSIASPRRYLGQLCKHFGHKISATYDEDYKSGRIGFPDRGDCTLSADEAENLLVMRVTATSEPELEQLEGVIGRHLERFAFRDPITVAWTRSV